MSRFCNEANVTGTDRTVMVGVYPMLRSSCPTSAVVAVDVSRFRALDLYVAGAA
jgi:hypothetical protein